MKRFAMLMVAATMVGTGVSFAQQAQQTPQAAQAAQARPQVTRSYRSYSVNPATRARRSHLDRDSTWRHADAKPSGQFHTGR